MTLRRCNNCHQWHEVATTERPELCEICHKRAVILGLQEAQQNAMVAISNGLTFLLVPLALVGLFQ